MSAYWWEKQLIFAGHTFSLSCWTCCFAVFDAARSDNSLARRNSIVIVITSSPDEGFLHNKTQTLHQTPGPSMLPKESLLMIAEAGVIGELNNHLEIMSHKQSHMHCQARSMLMYCKISSRDRSACVLPLVSIWRIAITDFFHFQLLLLQYLVNRLCLIISQN